MNEKLGRWLLTLLDIRKYLRIDTWDVLRTLDGQIKYPTRNSREPQVGNPWKSQSEDRNGLATHSETVSPEKRSPGQEFSGSKKKRNTKLLISANI